MKVADHRRRRACSAATSCASRERGRPRGRSRSPATTSTSPTAAAVEQACHRALPRRGRQLRGVDRRGRRRGAPRGGDGRERARRRQRRRGGGSRRVPRSIYPSTDYVFDGTKEERLRRVRRGRTRSRPTASRSSPARARPRPPTRATSSCARPGCSASTAATSSTRCSASRRTTRRSSWCATRSAARPTPAISPQGLVRLLDGEDYGIHHMAGGGRCSWYEFAVEIFSQAGRRCRVLSTTSDMLDRPGAAPAVLGARRASASTRSLLPDWQRGPRRLPRRARARCAA